MSAPELILKQLGGKRFTDKIGVTKLIEGNRTLSFNVKQNPKGVTHVHIVLEFPDLYDVKFLKVCDFGTETLHESYNIHPDDLRKIIADGTGLDTHL